MPTLNGRFGSILSFVWSFVKISCVNGFTTSLTSFAESLLWTPIDTSARRIVVDDELEHLPSWSWSGWTNGANYNEGYFSSESFKPDITQTVIAPLSDAERDDAFNTVYLKPTTVQSLFAFWSDTVPARGPFFLIKTQLHPSDDRASSRTFDPSRTLYRIVSPIGGPCGTLLHKADLPRDSLLGCLYIAISSSGALRIDSVFDTYFTFGDDVKDLELKRNVFGNRYNYYHTGHHGFNVMLVRPSVAGCFERVAVGYIQSRAWAEADPQRRRILLI